MLKFKYYEEFLYLETTKSAPHGAKRIFRDSTIFKYKRPISVNRIGVPKEKHFQI